MKNYKMENTTRPTETEYYPLENIDKQINGKRFINIILGVFWNCLFAWKNAITKMIYKRRLYQLLWKISFCFSEIIQNKEYGTYSV